MIGEACGPEVFATPTRERRSDGTPLTATTCTGTVVEDICRGADFANMPRLSSGCLKAQRGDLAGPGWPVGKTGGRGTDHLRTCCTVCCECSDASGLQPENCTAAGAGLPARLPAGVHMWLRQ